MKQDINIFKELDALRRLVRWMSPWIDDQVNHHGANLDDVEAIVYKRLTDSPLADAELKGEKGRAA